jgi:hypothetical protein
MRDFATRSRRATRATDDPLIRRLADPAYAAAYMDWIDSIVRRASGKRHLPRARHPRARL